MYNFRIVLSCPNCGKVNWRETSESNEDTGVYECASCGELSAPEEMSAIRSDDPDYDDYNEELEEAEWESILRLRSTY